MTNLKSLKQEVVKEFETSFAYKFHHEHGCSFYSDTAAGPMCTCGVMNGPVKLLTTWLEKAYEAVPEVCICAAIKLDDIIFRGHRHSDCIRGLARRRPIIEAKKIGQAEQGFITSRNRFVTREEGRKLQDAAGISSASPDGYMPGTLFSEDLY